MTRQWYIVHVVITDKAPDRKDVDIYDDKVSVQMYLVLHGFMHPLLLRLYISDFSPSKGALDLSGCTVMLSSRKPGTMAFATIAIRFLKSQSNTEACPDMLGSKTSAKCTPVPVPR